MPQPIAYAPNVERIEPDEQETIDGLNEQFRRIQGITARDLGHGIRAVHAKGHGIARGVLTIADGLPPELAQGLFAKPGRHEAIMRFSTNAGDILDDAIRLPRGVALKILDVVGPRLPGSEGEAVQDFIMVNGPAFGAPNTKKFLSTLKLLASTTDKAEGAKKLLSSVLRGAEVALEAIGGQSGTLMALGGAKPVHPLGATYFTQTPYRYGAYIAKFSLVPVADITAYADKIVDASGRPDAIREDMNAALVQQANAWELRVQLCTDLETMPIEDATVVWDETQSPWRTVAVLRVEPQPAWQAGTSEDVEDALSFSPWHGLAAHQPLGNINRARKSPYQASADFRARVNGCPIHQPRALEELPD